MDEKPLAFLSLVKKLETSVGHKTGFTLLDPFPCATIEGQRPAVLPIQKAGKTIASHMGLDEYVFIISVTERQLNVAGHIELDRSGRDVFIELSPDICQHKDAVLATICHELSHKYLHLNNIRNGSTEIEQEYLTDVTAVYLGLGKIMLNGCESTSANTFIQDGRTKTTARTLRTGYISRECFAFVYLLICAMRGISRESLLRGLSASARDDVLRCERRYSKWLRSEYRNLEGVQTLASDLISDITSSQDAPAGFHRAIRSIEQELETLKGNLCSAHRSLYDAQLSISGLFEKSQSQPNPHLRFLACVEVEDLVSEGLSRANSQFQDLRTRFENILRDFSEIAAPHSSVNEIIACPVDGVKLRVPVGRKRLLVTCPSCRYKFVVNTKAMAEKSTSENGGTKRSRFFRRLRAAVVRSS